MKYPAGCVSQASLEDARKIILKPYSLKKFKLYLNDRTIILHDVKVFNTGSDIRILSNPLTLSIRPIKLLGISAFDEDGFVGHVVRLPKFMWKMLQSNYKEIA